MLQKMSPPDPEAVELETRSAGEVDSFETSTQQTMRLVPPTSLVALAAASFRSRAPLCSAASAAALPPLVAPGGATLDDDATRARLAGKRVALYFSAGWCPMCTSFEPALKQFRQACEDSGKDVELIYVPSDRSADDAQERALKLDMLQVPFKRADELKKQHRVWAGSEALKLGMGRRSGVPALVVLDCEGAELAFVAAESQGVRALQAWPLDDARGVW